MILNTMRMVPVNGIETFIQTELDTQYKIMNQLTDNKIMYAGASCVTCPIAILLNKKFPTICRPFSVTRHKISLLHSPFHFRLPRALSNWIADYDKKVAQAFEDLIP